MPRFMLFFGTVYPTVHFLLTWLAGFKLLRMIANCPAEKVHWCPAVASCIHADENCIHADENCIHADENCITLWSKWIFFFLVQQLKLQLLPPIYTGKKMLFYMGVPSVKNKQLFSIKEMVAWDFECLFRTEIFSFTLQV